MESVTYGSIRAHEAILLIPFLDQSLICQVYDKEIANTPAQDIHCNANRPSRLY